MSSSTIAANLTLDQFITAALAYHRNRTTHLREGVWMIGRAGNRRRVIVRVVSAGIEAWQPETGRRMVWSAGRAALLGPIAAEAA